jgi:hypothetical protein
MPLRTNRLMFNKNNVYSISYDKKSGMWIIARLVPGACRMRQFGTPRQWKACLINVLQAILPFWNSPFWLSGWLMGCHRVPCRDRARITPSARASGRGRQRQGAPGKGMAEYDPIVKELEDLFGRMDHGWSAAVGLIESSGLQGLFEVLLIG